MKNKLLGFIAISILLFAGCERKKIARELKAFCSTEIIIPSELQKVYMRNISNYHYDGKDAILVNYYDSTSCSSCRISHLVDLLEIYEIGDQHPEFQVMTIFSPAEDKYDELMAELMHRDFQYPVYVDFAGEFKKINPHIPEDERFHSFLVDRNMKPVFVGDPVTGQDLWKLFEMVLNDILANDGEYK
jgi:lipoprotein